MRNYTKILSALCIVMLTIPFSVPVFAIETVLDESEIPAFHDELTAAAERENQDLNTDASIKFDADDPDRFDL